MFQGLVQVLYIFIQEFLSSKKREKDICKSLSSLGIIINQKSPLKRILSIVLKDHIQDETFTYLDYILLNYNKLSSSIKDEFYNFVSSLIPDYLFKEYFSILIVKHYKELTLGNFKRESEKNILSTTVQIFTTPIGVNLVEKYQLFGKIITYLH